MHSHGFFEDRTEALIAKLRSPGIPKEIEEDRDYVIEQLEEMRAAFRDGRLPPRDQRWPELTRLVVDQWPLGHPLTNEVGEVEALFRRL